MPVLPWEGVESTNWSTWNRKYLDFKTWSVIYKSWYCRLTHSCFENCKIQNWGDAVEEGRIVTTHPELLLLPSPSPLSWKFSFTLGKVCVKPVYLASSQVSKLTSTSRVAWGWGKDLTPTPFFPGSLLLDCGYWKLYISLDLIKKKVKQLLHKGPGENSWFPSDFFLTSLSRPIPLFCPECDLQANCQLAE